VFVECAKSLRVANTSIDTVDDSMRNALLPNVLKATVHGQHAR